MSVQAPGWQAGWRTWLRIWKPIWPIGRASRLSILIATNLKITPMQTYICKYPLSLIARICSRVGPLHEIINNSGDVLNSARSCPNLILCARTFCSPTYASDLYHLISKDGRKKAAKYTYKVSEWNAFVKYLLNHDYKMKFLSQRQNNYTYTCATGISMNSLTLS